MLRAIRYSQRKYYQKILRTEGVIGYWPGWEFSGPVARDYSGASRNGVYALVYLGQPGVGDGRTAPYYDGVGGFTNIFSPSLRTAFALTNNDVAPISEGTVLVWARAAVGAWADGVDRRALTLHADGSNRVVLLKQVAAGTLLWYYEAGGTIESVALAGLSTADWFNVALTWSASEDEMIAYYNGVRTGAIQTVLGAWAGDLAAAWTNIGAEQSTPTDPWHGWLAHVLILNRAAPPAEIASLVVV